MRVEQIGDATLYCADCRDVLPTLTGVDAVVTDPPYGLDFSYLSYTDTRGNLRSLIATAVVPAIDCAKRACVLPGITQVFMYPDPDWIGCITWDTTGSFGKFGFTQWMPALLYGSDLKGFGSINGGVLKSDVIRFTGGAGVGFQRDGADKDHPCPKPVNLMEAVVGRVSLAGDIILDPFMGSGTTGVACARLGRKFIGIEIEPRYFDIACRRIEQAQRQRDLFVPAPSRPVATTADMFAEEK